MSSERGSASAAAGSQGAIAVPGRLPPLLSGTPRSRLQRLARVARSKPLGTFSAMIIAVLVALAIFGPLITPYEPRVGVPGGHFLESPSLTHLLGTDHASRDILSRIIVGSRVSLWASLGAVLLGTGSGVMIGVVSGYLEGTFDIIVQRVIDAVMSIPLIVIAVMLISLVSPTLNNLIIALAIAISPRAARVARGSTLAVKSEVYVEAATVVGCATPRIIARHILPNIFAPIIVLASITMGGAIIAESSLNFLGLGPPTVISWGGMLSGPGREFMEVAPWMAVFPGLAIMITVLAFNLLGDGLRDVLDPRLRGSN